MASSVIGLKNISAWMIIIYRFREVNPVSMRIFQPERASAVSIEQKRKFQREVLLLSKIQHENIVQVLICFHVFISLIISKYCQLC